MSVSVWLENKRDYRVFKTAQEVIDAVSEVINEVSELAESKNLLPMWNEAVLTLEGNEDYVTVFESPRSVSITLRAVQL